ncbi:MAG: RNA 2',3'-cyclic phosphodiesterase [Burkholderiales bacterium]|nr:RNA 2',3'-cyclic phosphodiesterase [Burkholderiales bacterium]
MTPLSETLPGGTEADAATRVRAFFALIPDSAVRERLLALAREIARRSRGRVVSAEHLHLTLAFLGDVSLARVPDLRAIGDRLPHVAATLAFDTLGAWRASGVAWIAPSHVPDEITALHAALNTALRAAGFAIEDRPFRPHVTLARRCVQPPPRGPTAPIVWNVGVLSLVGSELRPDGPRYTTLAQWPLTPAR